LINPAFDFDPEILVKNEVLDSKYELIDKLEQRHKTMCLSFMKDHYMNTFNLTGGAAIDAYEKMMEQYDEFF
jgi:hypothetical protein